jgi:hypothetical protein
LRKRLWRGGFLVWHAENIYSSAPQSQRINADEKLF